MKSVMTSLHRRDFIRTTSTLAAGMMGFSASAIARSNDVKESESLYVIGPVEGYSPQIGTLVSMLNYNRHTIIESIKSLTQSELDHLFDPQSNTIAALVMHLGAVDKWYQINSFEGRDEFNESEKKLWNAGMNLGDEGRKEIKGKDAKYYLDLIAEVRQKTLEELKKKDDEWLLAIDPAWSKETPFNTYWKWFHVCEHESNHRGQITWLKGRLPGAKPGKE